MAKFELSGNTTVAELKKEFHAAFGAQLRLYAGRNVAEDTATLSSIGLTKEGTFECRSSRTVGSFIGKIQSEHGLKVKVYTCDDWVAVLDGLTLESAGKVKKQATKADMEGKEAYGPKNNNKKANQERPVTEQSETKTGETHRYVIQLRGSFIRVDTLPLAKADDAMIAKHIEENSTFIEMLRNEPYVGWTMEYLEDDNPEVIDELDELKDEGDEWDADGGRWLLNTGEDFEVKVYSVEDEDTEDFSDYEEVATFDSGDIKKIECEWGSPATKDDIFAKDLDNNYVEKLIEDNPKVFSTPTHDGRDYTLKEGKWHMLNLLSINGEDIDEEWYERDCDDSDRMRFEFYIESAEEFDVNKLQIVYMDVEALTAKLNYWDVCIGLLYDGKWVDSHVWSWTAPSMFAYEGTNYLVKISEDGAGCDKCYDVTNESES